MKQRRGNSKACRTKALFRSEGKLRNVFVNANINAFRDRATDRIIQKWKNTFTTTLGR
ncbi:hypothetical protein [Pontibacter mangrovi]|uniref:hypothetical protein n=1 Tax=Pontibacter mangrovi TaxID=2589816 RepID=UPI0015E2A95E|nr:hypothetical protein [Pontibacter mangrovi]